VNVDLNSYEPSAHSSPSVLPRDETFAASHQKGVTQEQRTSTHHAIRFNFSKSRACAHFLTEMYLDSHCLSIVYFYWIHYLVYVIGSTCNHRTGFGRSILVKQKRI